MIDSTIRSRPALMLLNASMMSRTELMDNVDVNTEWGERLENTVACNAAYARFGAPALVCGRAGVLTLITLHCGVSLLSLFASFLVAFGGETRTEGVALFCCVGVPACVVEAQSLLGCARAVGVHFRSAACGGGACLRGRPRRLFVLLSGERGCGGACVAGNFSLRGRPLPRLAVMGERWAEARGTSVLRGRPRPLFAGSAVDAWSGGGSSVSWTV